MSTNSLNKPAKSYNKLNMKKLSDEINNSGSIGAKTGTSGFHQQYTQNFMEKFSDKN